MKHGYLVDPAPAPDRTRRIPGQFARFHSQKDLGAGHWQWSGKVAGALREQQLEAGRFYQDAEGGIYFVPDGGPVDELTAAVAFWPPGTRGTAPTAPEPPPEAPEDGGDVILEEVIRPDGKAAFLVRFAAQGPQADLGAVLARGGMQLEDVTGEGTLTGTARLADGREVPFSGVELILCPHCAGKAAQ